MYEQHWRLTNRPFENRFQNEFYYPAEEHQAALLKLRYTIENQRSAAVLCGLSGMGKSLLMHSLLKQVHASNMVLACVPYPALAIPELFATIAERLGCFRDSESHSTETPTSSPAVKSHPHRHDLADVLDAMEATFQARLHSNTQSVLFIDEAHLLEANGLLEPLRMLLNVASGKEVAESALTIILCGQPTLLPHLQRNPSLEERVSVRCLLQPFSLDETISYIEHRVRVAGGSVDSIFESDTLEQVYQLTQGVPRRINRLCDLALMIGFAQDATRISLRLLDSVHQELAVPSLV